MSMDRAVDDGTDHYIDDIIVDEDKVSVQIVRSHLKKYGLVTKDPEKICDARVVGLRVKLNQSDQFLWGRDNDVGDIDAVAVAAKRRPADCRPAADQQFIHLSTRGQPKKRIPYNFVQTTY